MKLRILADGGSRGNPGPAAGGAVLCKPIGAWPGEIIDQIGIYIGVATNNQAEYTGLIGGLKLALAKKVTELEICLDSELVVKQIKGEYRVKHPHLKPLHQEAIVLLNNFKHYTIKHIPRAKNDAADKVVNQTLDNQ
ncbi:MAG: ribonuclease HI family protein [Patescibacteria group bacterium]